MGRLKGEFGDQVDDFIRDQVIDNGRSKRLRTKLLAERDLNLDRVIDLAGAMEASESQAAHISEGGERSYMVYGKKQSGRPTQQTVQKNQKRQPRHFQSNDSSSGSTQNSGGNACTRCGRRGHTADACQCTQNPSVSIVERPDISAKCVCPTVRMRSHVHVHVCR